jgi:hypothetical protein
MMIQMDMLDMVEALVSLLLLFEDTPSVFFFFWLHDIVGWSGIGRTQKHCIPRHLEGVASSEIRSKT